MSDLRPSGQMRKAKAKGKRPFGGRVYPTLNDALDSLKKAHGALVLLSRYRNLDGKTAFRVARLKGPEGKTIRPISHCPGGFQITAPPAPYPLLNLSDVANASVVLVVEGESCATMAMNLGLVATTSAFGAKSAAKTDWSPVAGKELWVFTDNDDEGRRYGKDILGILATLSPPPVVRVIELPGLKEGEDLVDWVRANESSMSQQELHDEIVELARVVEPVLLPPEQGVGPVLVCMADVEPREVSWLWPNRIPTGRLSLIVGRPGEGKSFVGVDIAARVSRGACWPDGSVCPEGSVILMAAEDDPHDTIRRRLDAQNANVTKVHLLTAVRRQKDGSREQLISLADVDAIEQALQNVPDCKLVVIDPIGSYLGGKVDAHRDNQVRAVLAPIAALASKYEVAILVVMHRRKGAGAFADEQALGSVGFVAISRIVWHVARDPEDDERRLLLAGKTNLAGESDGLAFSIEGDPVRLVWEPEPVKLRADDVLALERPGRKPGPNPEALDAAKEWLQKALAAGPRLQKELLREWKEQGGSKRTLDRAKMELKIHSSRNTIPGEWFWDLPLKEGFAEKFAASVERFFASGRSLGRS